MDSETTPAKPYVYMQVGTHTQTDPQTYFREISS